MNPPFDSNPPSHLLKFRHNYYGQVGGDKEMQRIEVHPDLLEEKARLVQQKKQELERMVWELEKSIYMLQSDWSGVTGERFFWDFMQVKEVFPTTLGLLDEIQKEFTFIAMNFRTTDGSGEVALYIPEELKRNFAVGLLDKSIGETITGMGQTAEAFFDNPFSTLGSVAYAMTVGRVVDVGRGIQFAWDTAWGTGTARSDIEQFVEEQKKQIDESGAGYYGGAMTGQALAYVLFGKAFRSKDDIGSGGGKPESGGAGGKREGASTLNEPVKIRTNKGIEVEFTNPSGNKISWIEQNPKNIPNAIESSLKSPNPGRALEGRVGEYVQQRIEVLGFALKANNITKNEVAGDLDVVTSKQIIEVKKSTAALDMEQIDKYINSGNAKFFNHDMKEVIVYIDKPIDLTNKYVKENIDSLKDSGVIVVNSLDELGGVLK
ncbi:WXG100 family type VII secretion target [Paenibacillus sp. W4I10]|uniref:WXG100 family type VII secretion target n=1 Tax=Paenibacillus sp. W4I10 TaxID=3042298 RepID=UPI002783FAFE|nr:WXG100 family type VII secretion target [Paenibacillus sp. W4I10]MDQ0722534.1 WXG100 family type VII secretion target [Paenibacillus sp. W4I10]